MEDGELERVVQWYPGHMVRTMRRIGEYLSLIDIVVEVIDARVVRSGANPMLDALTKKRARIVVLNREDRADPPITKAWLAHFAAAGREALATTGRDQQSVVRLTSAMSALAAGRRKTSRALIVGLPNSGKSSILNGLLRRAAANTEDRAGVTRQLQWFRLGPQLELMDTPGVLVPKIATKTAQWQLAICGAVPRERYDPEEVAMNFHAWAVRRSDGTAVPDLDAFAALRGFVRRGGEVDRHNAAQAYISAFNDGTFGRFSFESPDDAKAT